MPVFCATLMTSNLTLQTSTANNGNSLYALHPLEPRFIDPMSSTASFNASNELPQEALLQLPPHYRDLPAPIALSPRTIQTTLQTQADIDAPLLRSIANGLLQTITDREAATAIATKQYED
jgi:hypothetical protein